MSSAVRPFDAAVVIGRFQPFHLGHLSLLGEAIEAARRVIVVIGSSYQARSPRNPWTWEERARSIRGSVPAAASERIATLPLRDYYDERRWRLQIQRQVEQSLGQPRNDVVLIGHFEGRASKCLSGLGGWSMRSLPKQLDIDASSLRDQYFGEAEGRPHLNERLAQSLPESSRALLGEFAGTENYVRLASEWQALRRYRALWQVAPFPPVFVTSDAVVTCRGQVLLIRRGHHPGQGLFALPGGFIEQDETTLEAAQREVEEETRLDLGRYSLDDVLRDRAVFDHPERSQRGRTITHAFHFDLGDIPPPAVRAADDAARAEWIHIDRLASLEEQLFEDHFQILDRFLGLSSE